MYNTMKKILKNIGLSVVVGMIAVGSAAPVAVAQSYYYSGSYNVPPVWESKSTLSVAQGNTINFTVKAEDGNADPITYSAVRLPNGATFNPSTRLVTFSPNYDQLGTFPLVLAATDGRSNPVNKTFYVSVYSFFSGTRGTSADDFGFYSPNETPRITSNKSYFTVNPGERLDFSITATDPESDTLSLNVTDLPSTARFEPRTGLFSWTPVAAERGVYTMNFYASDAMSTSAPFTVTVAVGGGSVSRSVMSPYNSGVTVYTAGLYNIYGTTGSASTLRFTTSVSNMQVTPGQSFVYDAMATGGNAAATRYTLTLGPDGSFINESTGRVSWVVPAGAYNGQTFNFTVMAQDGLSQPATQSFTLTVVGARSSATTVKYVYRDVPVATQPATTPVTYTQVAPLYQTQYASMVGSYYPTSPVLVSTGRVVATEPMIASANYASYTGSVYGSAMPNALRSFNIAVRAQEKGDMVVTWDTNKASHSEIVYGYSSHARSDNWNTILNYDFTTGKIESGAMSHSVSLGKLEIGRTYYMRIISRTNTETDISREIVFIPMYNERQQVTVSQSYGAANVVGATDSFLTSNGFLSFVGLGALAMVIYALYVSIVGRTKGGAEDAHEVRPAKEWNEVLMNDRSYQASHGGASSEHHAPAAPHHESNGNGFAHHDGNGNGAHH